MKILALEFSCSQRSVAVLRPTRGPTPAFESEIIEAGGRSTKALGMIQRALSEARVGRGEIECIAVSLGPGSYTGIRAAIALAQGWQLARPVRLLGISSIEVLAAQAHADGVRGEVWFAVDAQRGDCYLAGWEIHENERIEREPLRIVSRQVAEAQLANGGTVCGPDLTRNLPGIRALHPSALRLGRLALERDDFVSLRLGRLALERDDFVSADGLRPVYLRETTFVKTPPPRAV